jgi:hypothetical protein
VFREVTGIDYGDDFERVIDEKLADSGALFVVIGDRWSTVTMPPANAGSTIPATRSSVRSRRRCARRTRWSRC